MAASPPIALARTLAASAIAFALPPRCPGCGAVTADDHGFCVDCWRALDFLGGPACRTCGEALPHDEGVEAQCEPCRADPPALDAMRAAVSYDAVPRRIALRLKHGRRPGLAETIARRLARLVPPGGEWIVAPVPLHRWRIWSRGYNQSALIGRALAAHAHLPFAADLLTRTRHTRPLRGLGRYERRRTVRDAFAMTVRDAADGRSILLIDDVFTTGATANACARVLKADGARAVQLLCWARVPPDRDGQHAIDNMRLPDQADGWLQG